jgi:cytochrome o ubiquinol oxidase operon protein cyoD
MSNGSATLRSYLLGLAMASMLTAAAFALVMGRAFGPRGTLVAITALAVLQVAVHLRYFLQLQFKRSSRDRLLSLVFTAILLALMIGGTVWVLYDLRYRMMSSLHLP